MIRISTEINSDEKEIIGVMATCPACGQKIGEIRYLRGVLILRVKCRRCGNYVDVSVRGDGEK